MASQANTLLSPQVITDNYTQAEHDWLDLGAFRHLGVEFLVLTPGSGGAGEKIVVESAAVDSDQSFTPVPGLEVSLNSQGTIHLYSSNFMRYVRVRATGTVTGDPVVTINTIAKE